MIPSLQTSLAVVGYSEPWWIVILKSLVIFAVGLQLVPLVLVMERKVLGRFQNRYGPNRVGPLGAFTPLADIIKLLTKEGFRPSTSIGWLFTLAPILSIVAAVAALAGRPVLAFAGIADPEKFFATLTAAGIKVMDRQSYPDHHRFTTTDAAALLARAERGKLELITTEKDFVRLGDPALAALAAHTRALPVQLVIEEADAFRRLVLGAGAPGK